ncbi:DUF2269 family protein [Legionella waltersii]|uniref:Integral membrane protein n=1 Tax=Legionella waltersii TaxID=66969 RepID=A0A0W1AAN2_9GAMM|nr:DUF2269 domain-containing protein [Legionella waltersii]KTD78397.1 integral membrane protein [Legionella waltersii]SNV06260.1 integral membrane protein [Legionella waltersii]
MAYLWLKLVHIISSTILFGTGLGTATVMLYGYYSNNISAMAIINRYVVIVDWIFTGTSGAIQPISGLLMVYIAGYPLGSLWILGSILGYLIAAICWFVVVYLQIKLRDLSMVAVQTDSELPEMYHVYFKWWFILGWPAFISLIVVFYLMVMKPF